MTAGEGGRGRRGWRSHRRSRWRPRAGKCASKRICLQLEHGRVEIRGMGWGKGERESDAFLQNANGPNVIDDGSSDDICLLLQHISGHFREPRARQGRKGFSSACCTLPPNPTRQPCNVPPDTRARLHGAAFPRSWPIAVAVESYGPERANGRRSERPKPALGRTS